MYVVHEHKYIIVPEVTRDFWEEEFLALLCPIRALPVVHAHCFITKQGHTESQETCG